MTENQALVCTHPFPGVALYVDVSKKIEYMQALKLLSMFPWDSKEYRNVKAWLTQDVKEGDDAVDITGYEWSEVGHEITPHVLFNNQVHRGTLSMHAEHAADYDQVKALLAQATAEISQLIVQYIQMRTSPTNEDPDAVEMVGILTDQPIQETQPGNERGSYSPLAIEAQYYEDTKLGVLFFITLDNTDNPPSKAIAMATQLTYQAVTEWIGQRRLRAVAAQAANTGMTIEFPPHPPEESQAP